MQTQLNAYLGFRDNAREAMEFYQSVFGGELKLDEFKDFGVSQDPNEDHKIMHGQLEAPNGIKFMAADTPNSVEYTGGNSISLALSGDNEAELKAYYEKLSADGTVQEPLATAPWGDAFGMLTDKYGITWMVNISAKQTNEASAA